MSEVKVKPLGKVIILVIVAGVAFGAYRLFTGQGLSLGSIIPTAQTQESVVPIKADLPQLSPDVPVPTTIAGLKLPSRTPANLNSPQIRWLHWAWNAQMGLLFASGGKETTEGSLMAERNVNIAFTRQDDPVKMQEGLIEFATALSRGNAQPDRGAHFVTIMGDGAAAFLAGLNDTLKKLGPEYTAKIVGTAGFSRGEDKFMGPKSWANNPESAKGGVVAGYLRDGDWNIAVKWLGDNGLKNNPDEKTYDPDALNWVATSDYIDAAEKYIAGYTETRPVVRNGKRTGQTKKIQVQGVVTWTPGDVNVAEKKGGIVSIVSTKEYNAQMPCVIIGIDKWMRANRETVENMLEAIFIGGDAVRSSSQAMRKAAEISAEVYGEQDASYWERYAKGTVEKDRTGQMVELGGSKVNNLADNMLLFGEVAGSANIYAAVYKVFGDLVKDQYPDLMPSYPPASEILDMSYLRNVAKANQFNPKDLLASDIVSKPTPTKTGSKPAPTRTISARAWNIQFESGKAAFKPQSKATLEKLIRELLVSGSTGIEIHGHTDNVGNPNSNMALSEARAFAVRNYLEKQAPRIFPRGRVRVYAHGQTQPLAPNSSAEGKARNRRVEIKITAAQ